ncbi:glycophorin-C [Rhea pennata]|uniref:glycophorin-C n=1 Tax=Rhea pennata TaxID=8795 RepID=UPI002E2608E7
MPAGFPRAGQAGARGPWRSRSEGRAELRRWLHSGDPARVNKAKENDTCAVSFSSCKGVRSPARRVCTRAAFSRALPAVLLNPAVRSEQGRETVNTNKAFFKGVNYELPKQYDISTTLSGQLRSAHRYPLQLLFLHACPLLSRQASSHISSKEIQDGEIESSSVGADVAVIGGVIAAVVFVLICLLVVMLRYMYRHKGTYHTNEAKGTEFAESADAALKNDPALQEAVDDSKKEYFI